MDYKSHASQLIFLSVLFRLSLRLASHCQVDQKYLGSSYRYRYLVVVISSFINAKRRLYLTRREIQVF